MTRRSGEITQGVSRRKCARRAAGDKTPIEITQQHEVHPNRDDGMEAATDGAGRGGI